MIRIFCDFETTGLNPHFDEIIEGYFLTECGRELLFRSRTTKWSQEAEEVHGISYDTMLSYPSKLDAYDELLAWLPTEFELVCYANPNTMFGYIHFDYAILKISIMDHLGLDGEFNLGLSISALSVYSLVKEAFYKGKINVAKNPKTKRVGFSQENVYRSLFGESYKSHVAKDDVLAMKRIYDYLIHNSSTNNLENKNQLTLL